MGTVTTLMPLWVVSRGAKYGLSGTVANGGGTGINAVTITLSGDASDTTTTAADGTWSFIDLKKGSYTITPTKTNYTFYPTSSAQTITNADISGVDFVSTLWILYDEFTTADAAPITSPRTCEPGPGTANIEQASNEMSIAGGELVSAAVADYSGFSSVAKIGSQAGKAAFSESTYTSGINSFFGFDHTNTASGAISALGLKYSTGGVVAVVRGNATPDDVTLGYNTGQATNKNLAVYRAAGGFIIVNGILLWVFTSKADRSYVQSPQHSGVMAYDTIGGLDLPANGFSEWNTEFGATTNVVESPSSGETTTSVANSWNEFTWTVAAAETLEWMIRRTDDTHTWIVRGDQAGSTIKVIEANAGETERSSAAQTWTDTSTYRVIAVFDDEDVSTFVTTTAKNTYASASYNKTVTGVKISGFAAGADLACWPRDVSALLPAQLV